MKNGVNVKCQSNLKNKNNKLAESLHHPGNLRSIEKPNILSLMPKLRAKRGRIHCDQPSV